MKIDSTRRLFTKFPLLQMCVILVLYGDTSHMINILTLYFQVHIAVFAIDPTVCGGSLVLLKQLIIYEQRSYLRPKRKSSLRFCHAQLIIRKTTLRNRSSLKLNLAK